MSIASAVKQYMDSPAGQKLLKSKVKELRKAGRLRPMAASERQFASLCDDLRDYILREAEKCDLAPSVMRDIRSLKVAGVEDDGENYIAYLNFTNDLSRESLAPNLYEDSGGGVYNIIALFNNGYTANNTVFGLWKGHSRMHGSKPDARDTDNGIWVESTIGRETLNFIGDAISKFNMDKRDLHNTVVAVANEIYDTGDRISKI